MEGGDEGKVERKEDESLGSQTETRERERERDLEIGWNSLGL
jgi:hypothetical protein